jgi:hypothetical protein
MIVRQRLRCPVCHKLLFEGFWVAKVLSIVILCRCKRVLEITETHNIHVKADVGAPLEP